MAAKYKTVAENLNEKIRSGDFTPGDVLPSEHQLAKCYGVSRITVRRAIEVLEESGHVERQHGRGTFVRYRTADGALLYIGRTHDHFYRDFYAALQRQAQQRGRALASFSPEHEEDDLGNSDHLEQLLEDAGALICQSFCWPNVCRRIDADCAAVQVTGWQGDGRHAEGGRPSYIVSTDTFAAARTVTEHLLQLGHQRIAYFGPGRVDRDREQMLWKPRPDTVAHQGYATALREGGLEPPAGIGFPEEHQDDWHMASESAIRQFIEEDGWPTAFVCEGDFRASPLLRVAMEMNVKVPEDLSVVGLCNTPWSEMLAPQLTSMDLREKEMARMAAMLVEQPPPESPVLCKIAPRLIERGSTAPPRD